MAGLKAHGQPPSAPPRTPGTLPVHGTGPRPGASPDVAPRDKRSILVHQHDRDDRLAAVARAPRTGFPPHRRRGAPAAIGAGRGRRG